MMIAMTFRNFQQKWSKTEFIDTSLKGKKKKKVTRKSVK